MIKITMTPKPSAPPMLAMMAPAYEMTGDDWTVDNPEAARAAKALIGNRLQDMPATMGKALESVKNKLATIKGAPVEQRRSLKTIPSPSTGATSKSPTVAPLLVMSSVQTVSYDPLPDSVFAVPAGYKKVAAPKTATTGM